MAHGSIICLEFIWSLSLTFELSASFQLRKLRTYSSLPELDADRQTAAECCLIAD